MYVSYDYGKSFKRISEKLSFGLGNSSEAVIAQFYHSPADNKRVRRRHPAHRDFRGLNSGTSAVLMGGGLGEGAPCHHLCSVTRSQGLFFR